jgi:hypothetical protein
VTEDCDRAFDLAITAAMLRAARRAEFAYYIRNRELGARFVPLPDAQLRAILAAAIAAIGEEEAADSQEVAAEEPEEVDVVEPPEKAVIVRARKPRPKRW